MCIRDRPYSTFYVKEYAGVDPQTGKALYYMNTQDANGNYDRTVTTDASAAQDVYKRQVYGQEYGGWWNSSRGVHSTDHLRLKSLIVGVSAPQSWLRTIGINSCLLYTSRCV